MDEIFIIEIIALGCGLVLLWTYALFPLSLWPLSALFGKPIARGNIYPHISIIISAYNEEKLITDAIKAIMQSDYPNEKIEVLCASDGSDDATVDILNNLTAEYNNLKVFDLPRMGKNAVLNEISPKASGDIICYSDADCRVERDTIRLMMQNYADESVGGVISPMISIIEGGGDTGGMGESLYQKYETHIRYREGLIYTTVNGLGAFYSIRRDMYRPLPDNMVCDDLMPVLNVAIQRKRMIFDKRIITKEVREKSLSDELSRRVRVASGGLATIVRASELLNPLRGWSSLFLWSHKLIRTLSPVFLIGLIIATPILYDDSGWFWILAILQGVFYLSAIAGWILDKLGINIKPFRLALYFVTMNIGFTAAIIRFLGRAQNARWQRN
jgi:cellulose synthase/poly-beta-1,6-N-acetylglucosamine synthase-like glycosyltransferase